MPRVKLPPEKPQRPMNWAPIVGRWEATRALQTYLAPQAPTGHPFGLLVSDVSLAEGEVRAAAKLNDRSTAHESSLDTDPLSRATYPWDSVATTVRMFYPNLYPP